ncbi:MFS transporter [Streptomyces iranensis]|uniref:Putative proline/betaine transporter n=1 Tax=Streptomyces iranensis TaxID=576784 RepID=A0A060ZQB0_9ACTN|nr:MFS transporter [Streptomyces iranensis]MBP2066426.1 MHS family alpha-ketoglutarate permease-like MFS transporter [Streptomyces iranensis]CDR05242.1 General substrate transporter [Streptomyces iranensis]
MNAQNGVEPESRGRSDRLPPTPRAPRKREVRQSSGKSLFSVLLGNCLEWYDWGIFTVFAATFAPEFFPGDDPVASLLGTLAIYAVGFFFRPLGGLVLGAFTDRHGRRAGMIVAMLLMAGGSALIAVSPSYEAVGVLAPAIMLIARALQGISTGGEAGASYTYLAEAAPNGRRGLFGSLGYVSATVGVLLANTVGLWVHSHLAEDAVSAWGWRLGFALGAVLGLWGIYLRRALPETEAFESARASRAAAGAPTLPAMFDILTRYPLVAWKIFGLTAGSSVWYYLFASYLPEYAAHRGLDHGSALTASIISQAVLICALPLLGALSDRVGHRLHLVAFATIATLAAVPLLALLRPTFGSLVLVQSTGLVIFAVCGAAVGSTMAEQLPTEVRAAGLGLPYALSVAIFGGTAPFAIEWLNSRQLSGVFPWYVAALCAITLVSAVALRERRHQDLRDIPTGEADAPVTAPYAAGRPPSA